MRVDKYLQLSRLIKQREKARAACEAGAILLNGHLAKPGKTLKIGDGLALKEQSGAIAKYKILVFPWKGMKKGEAVECYEFIERIESDKSSPVAGSEECPPNPSSFP